MIDDVWDVRDLLDQKRLVEEITWDWLVSQGLPASTEHRFGPLSLVGGVAHHELHVRLPVSLDLIEVSVVVPGE